MALHTTASAGLSPQMKTFYDRQLLVRTVPVLLHAKFAQKRPIPKNKGRVIEFRQFSGLAVATTPLTEGTPPTLKDITSTAVTASVAQFGDAVGGSDLVSTTTIDPILREFTDILAEQAAETIDELIRDTLAAGTNVVYSTVSANTQRGDLAATDIITADDVALLALTLQLNRAQKINGAWQAIAHPRILHDLRMTTEWITANNEHQTGRIFDGSVGMLHGVKFWESDKAAVFANEGAGGTVDVYTMLVLGKNAYGIVDLAGHNLQTYFKPLGSAGTADPIDQQWSLGWKVTFGVKRLYEAFMVRYECATSTGANT